MTDKLPYVKWRDGSPRFSPSARERALGFKGEDLRHPDGTWFDWHEARKWSAARLEEIHAARKTGAKPAAAAAARSTVAELLEDWLASPHLRDLAPATHKSYRTAVDAILYKPTSKRRKRPRRGEARAARTREPFADARVAAIGPPELRAFFNTVRETRGHHQALLCVGALSSAMTWGRESTAWRLGPNPRAGMSFPAPPGRVVIITLEEFDALVAAADELGLPSIGDALYLGLFTGQRQADRLALKDEGLVDGRRHFRQSKTGAVVRIKEVAELTERLAAARKRVTEIMLAKGTRPEEIVVHETTGRAYNPMTYRNNFAMVRSHAAKSVPSVKRVRDQDLRDTCVTMLDRSGADLKTICDVTGHSYSSVETIIKHYLGNNPARADKAMDRLATFISDGRRKAMN